MKVSLNWLKELLAPGDAVAALDAATAAQALTRVGLEVEEVEEKGRELAGIVVAEVLGMRPHPGADKLRLVRVRAGAREEEVVCGAPNVPPAGNRVAWATPGARLPGGRVLEAREVRGVMSPGMLCSEVELGLVEKTTDKGDGILVLSPSDPAGADLVAQFGIADDVLEVNVTANRPDALSHLGIARELAAALGVELRPPVPRPGDPDAGAPDPAATRDVRIADAGACPRYQARFLAGASVAPSPLAVRLRLAHCGVRPISNLVDVTNWVLLELGHPLHAFDMDRLAGGITVRRSRPDEHMTTLDGIERRLQPGDVVIADERGPVALAGVMGGRDSEVSASTRNLLLEAATFDPVSVRRTSKRLGLVSEASYRFERGVDAEGIPLAAARAAELLARLGGARVLPAVVDRYPQPAPRRTARVTVAQLRRLSGLPLDADEAARQLGKVSPRVTLEGAHAGDGADAAITVEVPSYRPDLVLPEDLIEEVLRLGGRYETPARIERVLANARPLPSPEGPSDRARDVLAACGLSEVATWGFVPRGPLAVIAGGGAGGGGARPEQALADAVAVKNPISADYEVMRTSLLPGLAEVLRRNVSRGVADVGVFEVGPVVHRDPGGGEPIQRELAAVLLSGNAAGWLRPGEALDFFDLKRVLEALLAAFGAAGADFSATGAVPYLHPGVAAEIALASGEVVGHLGELHPVVARRLGVEARALYGEVDLARLAGTRPPVRAVVPPRFPAATRDLSFWVDEAVPAAAQRAAFLAAAEPLLRELVVLEEFRDPRYAPAGKKGMLWSMAYRADDRTLTDADADAAHGRVVAALSARLPIVVR
jgi:phenylalanyl-tRNA synthetase beta chain